MSVCFCSSAIVYHYVLLPYYIQLRYIFKEVVQVDMPSTHQSTNHQPNKSVQALNLFLYVGYTDLMDIAASPAHEHSTSST